MSLIIWNIVIIWSSLILFFLSITQLLEATNCQKPSITLENTISPIRSQKSYSDGIKCFVLLTGFRASYYRLYNLFILISLQHLEWFLQIKRFCQVYLCVIDGLGWVCFVLVSVKTLALFSIMKNPFLLYMSAVGQSVQFSDMGLLSGRSNSVFQNVQF